MIVFECSSKLICMIVFLSWMCVWVYICVFVHVTYLSMMLTFCQCTCSLFNSFLRLDLLSFLTNLYLYIFYMHIYYKMWYLLCIHLFCRILWTAIYPYSACFCKSKFKSRNSDSCKLQFQSQVKNIVKYALSVYVWVCKTQLNLQIYILFYLLPFLSFSLNLLLFSIHLSTCNWSQPSLRCHM